MAANMPNPSHLTLRLPARTLTLDVSPTDRVKPLTDLFRAAGYPLNTRCGGKGLCDGCMIHLLAGDLSERGTDRAVHAPAQNLRACEFSPAGDATLAIPQRALLAYEPHALIDFVLNVAVGRQPLDATPGALGAAIDIGTTTIAVLLVDLATGKVLARAAEFNRQMHLGDDVITRIQLCQEDPANLPRLQAAVIGTLSPLLLEVLAQAQVEPARLGIATIAGNTTMLHLLAGVDPTPMGRVPYTPAFLEPRIIDSATLPGWPPEIRCPLHLLPGGSAFIGADLVAGALASGLAYDDGPSLLVDAGTNGEILLKAGRHLLGCATAAGPAFEGAGLTCGIRAGAGAVAHLYLHDGQARLEVIGGDDVKPRGLCGSAYIDLLAEGRHSGLLTRAGRFDREASAFPLTRTPRGWELELAGNVDLRVTEADLAKLLTAKAAIAAGILCLLRRVNLAAKDVRTVYLAGGFGTHLNAGSALRCGLLPGFNLGQIRPVGNSALAGAYLALLDESVLAEMQRFAAALHVLNLNAEPAFEGLFIEQMGLE